MVNQEADFYQDIPGLVDLLQKEIHDFRLELRSMKAKDKQYWYRLGLIIAREIIVERLGYEVNE